MNYIDIFLTPCPIPPIPPIPPIVNSGKYSV